MTQATLSLPQGVSVSQFVSDPFDDADTVDTQDDVLVSEREERRQADAIYWRTIRREKHQRKLVTR